MNEQTPRLLPRTDDRDTSGFWEAAAEGRLVLKTCTTCGTVLHLPRGYCGKCGSFDTEWKEFSGRGHIYTWTVVERSFHPGFPAPYTIIAVEVEHAQGARLMGYLPGRHLFNGGELVELYFETLDGGVKLPNWKPVSTGSRKNDVR